MHMEKKSNKNTGSKLGHFILDSKIQGRVPYLPLSPVSSPIENQSSRMVSKIDQASSVSRYCELLFLGTLWKFSETDVKRAPLRMFSST